MMDAKQKKQVQVALARSVAERNVSDTAISAVVDRLDLNERIRGIDPCELGICWDFFVDKPVIDDLIRGTIQAGRLG